jgi:hypothetical protein
MPHFRTALSAEAVDRPPLFKFSFASHRPEFLWRHHRKQLSQSFHLITSPLHRILTAPALCKTEISDLSHIKRTNIARRIGGECHGRQQNPNRKNAAGVTKGATPALYHISSCKNFYHRRKLYQNDFFFQPKSAVLML